MKKMRLHVRVLFVLALASVCGPAAATTAESRAFVRPDNPHIQTIGRVVHDPSSGALMFDQPDTQLRIRVQGVSRISILLQQLVPSNHAEPSNFAVFVDGKLANCTSHPAPNAFSSFTTLASGNNTLVRYTFAVEDRGPHQIELYKTTEAAWNERNISPNYVTFSGFELKGIAPQTLTGPPLPTRKLEFVGDSITCGYCNLCHETNQTYGVNLESGFLAWPAKICRSLGAQCHKSAWSGFGVVRNCCGGDTFMPEIYKRTLATVENSRWNFSSWIPDAVIINLGTNDHLPAEPAPVDESFVAAYVEMVYSAAMRYGKNRTHFFLACGPMSTTYCDEVNSVLKNVTSVGIKASFLDQRGLIKNPCCGHPSVSDDEAMAELGSAFIKKVLNW
eukprot:g2591.t1